MKNIFGNVTLLVLHGPEGRWGSTDGKVAAYCGEWSAPFSDDKNSLGDSYGLAFVFICAVMIRGSEYSLFPCSRFKFVPGQHRTSNGSCNHRADRVLRTVVSCGSLTLTCSPAGDHRIVRGIRPSEQRRGVCLSVGQTAHVAHRTSLAVSGRREYSLLSLTIYW